MYNLVRADLFKLYKSMTIKVLFFITCLSATTVTIFSYLIERGGIHADTMGIGFFLADIQMMTLLGAIMATSMVCGDFENKTIQGSISYGNSRGSIIVGKALAYFISITIILLPYIVTTVVAFCTGAKFSKLYSVSVFLNIMANEANLTFSVPVLFKMMAVMLTITVVYAARLSICVLLAFLLRRPILVIGLGYGLTLFFDNVAKLGDSAPILKAVFTYTPFSGDMIGLTLNTGVGSFIKVIVNSLVFILITLGATYGIFRKSEVKTNTQ